MQKYIGILFGMLALCGFVQAQKYTDLTQNIPFDPAFRTGVLPNGLTYYIRHNETPRNRASFYIYQNVGAVLESDEQDGLAHFLEHMAFNGTHTFPGKSLLNMLETNGVKFGKDINAYTDKNETVYNISQVPVARQGLIDSCLLILRDWCNELELDQDEIDAERGVISEEWRTRRNAAFRLNAKMGPVVYNGSIYAKRDVIGELDVIQNFEPAVLRQFYHDWYRTDLQAIAIVGDVDVDKIEQQVIELFGAIPAVENPKERKNIIIPDNQEPLYVVATDKELKNVTVKMSIRHPYEVDNSMAALRANFVSRFFNALIKSRLNELKVKGEVPFLGAQISYGGFERGYRAFNIKATAKVGEEAKAFEAVYTELQRVINFGFTQGELDRLKTNMLVTIENQHANQQPTSNDNYCKKIKGAYLQGGAIPSSEFSYEFSKEIIPTITVEEVSAEAGKYLSDINCVFSVIGPDKQGIDFISQDELEEIIAQIEASELTPYVDKAPLATKLMTELPVAGKIIKEKAVEPFDAIEWTLSNGAKVVYRFANYQKGIVALKALSYGGSSLYNREDIPSLGALKSFGKSFGIGSYSASEYKKLMTGNTANSNFEIGGFGESVSAVANPNDIETMMQLVHMRFTQPNFDKEAYDRNLKRSYEALARKQVTGKSIMKDTLSAILSNGNPRTWEFTKEYLDAMDYERMKAIYRERFANASDFIFFIVGDVDAETLKPLVEQYMATLPSASAKNEKWVDNGNYFPKGKNTYSIAVPMTEPKGTVMLKLRNKAKYSRETVVYQSILKSVLQLRFTENIREKEGGTYGVSVKTSVTTVPDTRLSMNIQFDCDPAKAEHLKGLVYKELNDIQHMVLQSDLDKVVRNMKKNNEHVRERNQYWMNALQTYYDSGENILESAYYEDVLNNVTTKDIQQAAKKFMKKADVVDVVFYPQ